MSQQISMIEDLYRDEKSRKILTNNNLKIARSLKMIESNMELVLSYRNTLDGNFFFYSGVLDRIVNLKSILAMISYYISPEVKEENPFHEMYRLKNKIGSHQIEAKIDRDLKILKEIKRFFMQNYSEPKDYFDKATNKAVKMFREHLEELISYIFKGREKYGI